MATIETNVCDIFGVVKGVKPVEIFVTVDGETVTHVKDLDMSPRALERLNRFIANGISKPKARRKKLDQEETS